MNRFKILILFLIVLQACGKDYTIELPEINKAQISEIHDISPAFIFYDITQKDSVKLNRGQLISTTNWLVNVDKRLTLKQAIPHIQFLQNKKRKAKMHKNEHAKNYFTCNDLSKNTLGFIEFTNLKYYLSSRDSIANYQPSLVISSLDELRLNDSFIFPLKDINSHLKPLQNTNEKLTLIINSNMDFQDYITLKSTIINGEIGTTTFSNKEIIYN